MADKKKKNTTIVVLRHVRLSFADIYKAQKTNFEDNDGNDVYKFGASFLMEKGTKETEAHIALFNAAKKAAMEAKYGKVIKLKAERICLRDGDEETYDGYADMDYISTSAREENPPKILTNFKDKDKKWIPAKSGGDHSPYSGCYVNAIISIWAQDNKEGGKRINAELLSVQFYDDGDSFGRTAIDENDYYDDDDAAEGMEFEDDDEEEEEEDEKPSRSKPKKSRKRSRPSDDDEDDDSGLL